MVATKDPEEIINEVVATKDPEEIINEVCSLYEDFGGCGYVGEKVTQLQHAQQVSYHAKEAGASKEVELGAFFHDVGHLLGIKGGLERYPAMYDHNKKNIGTANHDQIGANYLESLGFPKAVTDFVLGHVQAKRYLVFKYPEYHDNLSEASKGTLINQGGPMNAEEAMKMEKRSDFQAIIDMRSWDDKGKDVDVPLIDNEYYKNLCRIVLGKQRI